MPPKAQSRAEPQRRSGRLTTTEEPTRQSSKEGLPTNDDSQEALGDISGANEISAQGVIGETSASQTAPTPSSITSPAPPEPVERLASLRGPGRFIESHNWISSDSQVKRLKVQPKSAIRRSKEEREATEKAEAERLHARLAASGGSSSNVPRSGDLRGRGSARGPFGGVSTRWQSERYSGGGASGFLGGATPAEDKRQRESFSSRSRGSGRSAMLSGLSRESTEAGAGPKVKKESGARKSRAKDKDGDSVMGGTGRRRSTRIKKEEGGPMHQESDDDLLELEPVGKRINIENINLISDEESSNEALAADDKGKGKEKSKTPKLPGSSFMRPIRISRHQHVDRSVGVSTEPSSLTSAELRRRAKERGEAQGSLFLPDNADLKDDRATKPRRKTKSRDVEFIKNERKWQGVYQDEEDEDKPVKIKKEPKEDDNSTLVDDAEPSGTAVTQNMLAQNITTTSEETAAHPPAEPNTVPAKDPSTLRKPRIRIPKAMTRRKPVLQTEEDHQEWHRFKSDVALIRNELRMSTSGKDPTDLKTDADGEGDPNVEEMKLNEHPEDKKEGLVYLFQLPPTMPEIEDPRKRRVRRKSQAQKPDSEDQQDSNVAVKEPPTTVKDSKTSKPKRDTESKTAKPAAGDPKIKTEPPDADSKPSVSEETISKHAVPPTPFPTFPYGTLGNLRLDAE
ncbi:MAG: hypothetical protein Q9225_006220, partial [Loekoesia sp. 1 TL-2023]